MAYVTGKTSVLQTAIKAAVDVATAELAAGVLAGDIDTRIKELEGRFFSEMSEQVDADNALFAANDTPKGGSKRSSGGSSKQSSGGGNASISLEEAQGMVLNFGAFRNLTLAQVFDLDAKEAGDYGYPEKDPGSKTGRQYIEWLAKNTDPKAGYAAKRAAVIVEAARAASDAA